MLFENVSRLCDEKRISIFELERQLAIGNGTIGKWKNRGQSPRYKTLKLIADYFGVTLDELTA